VRAQIGARGVRALATALGANASLRELDLSHNLLAARDIARLCAVPARSPRPAPK
jgi:hypothetical protein